MPSRSTMARNPARTGIESRVDGRGRERFRAKVYDKNLGQHVAGPWVGSLAEARSWRIDKQAAIKLGRPSSRSNALLAEAMVKFLRDIESGAVSNRSGRRFKPSVCRSYASSYRLYIERELGPVRVDEIRRRDIQALIDRLKLNHRPSTVRNAVMPLRAYFRWATARDIVPQNPTVGIELPSSDGSRDRVVPADVAIGLVRALPEADQGLWATWFFAGLRAGESRALRFEDVDLVTREIRVERSWDQIKGPVRPKSEAGRRKIPMPQVLTAFLVAHQSRVGWSHGLIFGRSATKPFNPSSVTKRADRIWKRAGLERITPHEARHTFASLMIEAMIRDQTLNVKVISEIMGHASITETYDRYAHLLPGSTGRAVDALDSYLADVPKNVPTG